MHWDNNTALTLRDAKLLIKYLDGVDEAVTIRLQEGFNPDEPFLTMLLCEMLDQNHTSRHVLSYPFGTLRSELQADPKGLDAELTIDTVKYPTHLESRVTFSDFGVVVTYEDDVLPDQSFVKAALFQAKKLYPSSDSRYSLNNRFGAFDADQLVNIANLSLQVPNAPHYLFMCPRPNAYDPASSMTLHRLVVPSGDIYDFSMGWHKQEYANDPNRYIPGLVVSDLAWLVERYLREASGVYTVANRGSLPSARQVYGQFWNQTRALSWFLVYDMLMGSAGSKDPRAVLLALGLERQDDAPFLPRYVIRLKVSVSIQSPQSYEGRE